MTDLRVNRKNMSKKMDKKYKLYCRGNKSRYECLNCLYYIRGKSFRLEHNDGYRILEPPKLKAREKCKIKRLDFEPIN